MTQSPSTTSLRLLFVGDTIAAARLQQTLEAGRLDPVLRVVSSSEALSLALRDASWDVVVQDRCASMSTRSVREALVASGAEVPLVVVTEATADGAAAGPLPEGAVDLVRWDRPMQLRDALARALRLGSRDGASRDATQERIATVAHDLTNVLNPLALHIQFASFALDRGDVEEAKRSLAEMHAVLRRGLATIERLRRGAPE